MTNGQLSEILNQIKQTKYEKSLRSLFCSMFRLHIGGTEKIKSANPGTTTFSSWQHEYFGANCTNI